jgi:hypothetical protein
MLFAKTRHQVVQMPGRFFPERVNLRKLEKCFIKEHHKLVAELFRKYVILEDLGKLLVTLRENVQWSVHDRRPFVRAE